MPGSFLLITALFFYCYTTSDIGQMNLYLNYFKNEVCQPDDNPPVGIVLGARKDELLMEYALQGCTERYPHFATSTLHFFS